MKISYIIPLLLLCCTACQSEQQKRQAEITRLEKRFEADTSDKNAEALLQLYQSYRSTYPSDSANSAYYGYRQGLMLYTLKQPAAAADTLYTVLSTYPQAVTPEAIILLAKIYETHLESPQAAITLYQAGAGAFPNNEVLKTAQSADWQPVSVRMEQLRNSIFDATTGRLQRLMAADFIRSAQAYALLQPNEAQAAQLLYQAGEVAGAAGDYAQTLQLYERLNKHFPTFEKNAQVLFMRAFTHDEMGQLEEARQLYEAFLAQYPDHEFAKDAKVLLKNLGKSAEEIIQSFMQQEQ